MEQFVIDFNYNGASYSGLVTPKEEKDELFYSVHLESENQEYNLDVVARECDFDKMEWCFRSPDGQEPPQNIDKDLLQEIGETSIKLIFFQSPSENNYENSIVISNPDLGIYPRMLFFSYRKPFSRKLLFNCPG